MLLITKLPFENYFVWVTVIETCKQIEQTRSILFCKNHTDLNALVFSFDRKSSDGQTMTGKVK